MLGKGIDIAVPYGMLRSTLALTNTHIGEYWHEIWREFKKGARESNGPEARKSVVKE